MNHAVPPGTGRLNAASIVESKIFALSRAEIDACPLGIIELDRSGMVVSYNSAEAQIARYPAGDAVGKNFFTAVAPCAAVREFQGRFTALADAAVDACERFTFVFRFAWGDKKVWISMVTRSGAPGRIFLVVDAANV